VAKKILIVDDDREIREQLSEFLRMKNYEVIESSSGKGGQEAFSKSQADAILLDYSLPDANALELIPLFKRIDESVPIIVVTGNTSIELAVQAMREGAEHFLTKPVQLAALGTVLDRALENSRNRRAKMALESRSARASLDPFLGTSRVIKELREDAEKILNTDRPILIQGETGTGKGVLATWLHMNGPRADEVFVDLNCAGLAREFLETELFGHEKGAFTGAVNSKTGLLEVGHQGTVFLDEIGDVDMQVQPKLLKVLEEKQFRRLGSVRDRQVDIRLIAATHQDLAGLVRKKAFRDDLYFRISTLQLRIPPLRQRIEDIPTIADLLLQRLAVELGRDVAFEPDMVTALQQYAWPGNIRELRNVVERTVLLSGTNKTLHSKDLRFDVNLAPDEVSTDQTLTQQERRHIEEVLQAERGQVARAAKILGLSRSSLYRKIKDYGIRIRLT
jgi:DNA-binding NtrC family response regulator